MMLLVTDFISHCLNSVRATDPQYDYIVAIFIGIGIAMFMTSTDELTFDFDVYGEQSSAKWTGVMLLLFFLFFDSFTSQVCGDVFDSKNAFSNVSPSSFPNCAWHFLSLRAFSVAKSNVQATPRPLND